MRTAKPYFVVVRVLVDIMRRGGCFKRRLMLAGPADGVRWSRKLEPEGEAACDSMTV